MESTTGKYAISLKKIAYPLVFSGAFLTLVGIFVNVMLSTQIACLETLPQTCYTGYDTAPNLMPIASPVFLIGSVGLLVAGLIVLKKTRKDRQ